MDDEARLAKNKRIAETKKKTKERHASMDCRSYTVKLKPNGGQTNRLHRLFAEAKWIRNAALDAQVFDGSILKSFKNDGVPVKNKAGEVEYRTLDSISVSLQQSVIQELSQNLRALASKKRKGYKVGRLKFKSEVNSVDIIQFGYNKSIKGNKVKIPKLGWMRAYGLEQFNTIEGREVANARIIRKASGFYLRITVFTSRGGETENKEYLDPIGVDMGVKTHLTLSDGTKVNCQVRTSERLRRLQRKLSRQQKRSQNWYKTKHKIRLEYERLTNRVADFANKQVHELLQHSVVVIQDENLRGWKNKKSRVRGAGKRLHYSGLGRIKSKLMNHPRVVVLDRFTPTTAWCPACGRKTKHSIDKRVFVCNNCYYNGGDRDIHAAKNILTLGIRGSACGAEGKTVVTDFSPVTEHLAVKQETVKS